MMVPKIISNKLNQSYYPKIQANSINNENISKLKQIR